MCGINMLVLLACMPAFASSQLAAKVLQAGARLPGQASRVRLPPLNAKNAFAPMYAPYYAPSFAEGDGKDGTSSHVQRSYYGSSPSSGFSAPSRGYVAPAPAPYMAPSASGSGEFAGMSQDQIDFIRRKRGEIGMDGGLDTHGRPRHGGGGGAAPAAAPAPVAAPAASGEFAGMTPDQIEFIRRKRGEIAMSGGLDTHGRPRHLDAQESSSDFWILTTGLLGFFIISGITFALMRLRHAGASDEFRQPFLTA